MTSTREKDGLSAAEFVAKMLGERQTFGLPLGRSSVMKPLLSKLLLLVAVSAVAGSARAQWSPPPAMETIDLPAVNSRTIVTGRIVDLKRAEDQWTNVDITVDIKETLKGEGTGRITAHVVSHIQPRDLDRYKARASLLLIGFPEDVAEPITVIDLSAPDLAVFTADLKLLRKPEDVIRAVKERVRQSKRATKVEPYMIVVPGKTFAGTPYAKGEDWNQDGTLRLQVPIDDRLERYAQKGIRSKDPRERLEGIRALGLFRSDPNIGMLVALLNDPAWVWMGEYSDNKLFRYRTNEIRRQAYAALLRLHVSAAEPVSIEPTDRNSQVAGIELDQGNVAHADIEALSLYPNLENLYLSNAKLTEVDYAAIGRLSSIKRLYLDSSNMSDPELSTLARLPNLVELRLENTVVTDAGLAELAKFRRLKSVHLGQAVTDRGVAALKRRRPDLRVHRDEFAFLAPLLPRRIELARVNFRGWVRNPANLGTPEPRYYVLVFPAETAAQAGAALAKNLPSHGWLTKPLANSIGADYIRGRVVPNTIKGGPDTGKFMVIRDEADAIYLDADRLRVLGWLQGITLAPGELAIVIRLFDARKR